MAVKRDRPDHGVPGELHTPDGRSVRVKLPPGLTPPAGSKGPAAEDPRPAEPERHRASPRRDVPPSGPA
jgi:hypothetical protein